MPTISTLICPNCSGKLNIPDQLPLLACSHCGSELLFMREGETFALVPRSLNARQTSEETDTTKAEWAIMLLRREARELEMNIYSAEDIPIDKWILPSLWETMFTVASIAIFLGAVSAAIIQNIWLAICLFAISIGCLIILETVRRGRYRAASRQQMQEIARLRAKLAAIQRQLNNHPQIVSS